MKALPKELLAELGRTNLPPEVAEEQQRRRARVVQRLEVLDARLATKSSRLRRFLAGAAAVAVAAGVALAVGLGPGARGDSVGEGDTVHVSVVDGKVQLGATQNRIAPSRELDLTDDDRVTTPGSSQATLKLANGALVSLSPTTEVRFGGENEREAVELYKGSVSLAVPKLLRGRLLEVSTFDTKVTVHGTRFSVAVKGTPEAGRWTEVQLTEGVISIESGAQELRLNAPSRWSSRTTLDAPKGGPASSAVAEDPARPVRDERAGTASARNRRPVEARKARVQRQVQVEEVARPAPETLSEGSNAAAAEAEPEPEPKHSTLAQQNSLFSRARTETQNGQLAQALQSLDMFLAQYPNSPLRQNVVVERFRLLTKMGRRAQASQAARRYLAIYPDGFARDEARAIAISKP